MAQNKIVTDENLMESAKHGTDGYPFNAILKSYHNLIFIALTGIGIQNGNLYMLNPET